MATNLYLLQYLYLDSNAIEELPDDFFNRLPRLKWLDLRFNNLKSLPSVYLGRHHNLRTILLDGNQLKSLPLELGECVGIELSLCLRNSSF